MERFQEMRLQAMMALLVARPLEMGQWYSRSFFEGDYSISQRASILNALGMGARELGGYAEEDGAITSATSLPGISFPSKKLPQRLHNVYSDSSKPVNALAANLEKKLIEPMAADAADKLSGPNALKVRTFSSRMAVEQKRKPPKANPLAKIVGAAFVFPLTGRWWVHLKAKYVRVKTTTIVCLQDPKLTKSTSAVARTSSILRPSQHHISRHWR